MMFSSGWTTFLNSHLSQAILSEYKEYFPATPVGASPWELPSPTKGKNISGTIFDQKFLTVVVDEAHQYRNAGIKHSSILRVLNQASIRLILTATPVHTGIRVLAYISNF
jgi:hypothetical protein